MRPMAIDRRQFILGSAAFVAAPGAAAQAEPRLSEDRRAKTLFAAARRSPSGYSAAIFTGAGTDVNSVVLPARGHDLTVCPVTQRCVAFARRPGNFAVSFSGNRDTSPVRFTTPEDRHFYGHGVFAPDGKLLYATENDFEAGEGRIGIYDATSGFERVGEFSTHGIGPHDLALMPDGRTLVIANGGVETHPEIRNGREPLNLATMEPSLAYIDRENGDLIERHTLPDSWHRVSLRHLDVGEQRTLIIGGQFKGEDARTEIPLVVRHRPGSDIVPVDLPGELALSLRGYISSVAVDASGNIAALTASRGSCVLFVEVASGRFLGSRDIADVSGVAAATNSGFLLTTGHGEITTAGPAANHSSEANPVRTSWQWDNHAIRVC